MALFINEDIEKMILKNELKNEWSKSVEITFILSLSSPKNGKLNLAYDDFKK